MRGPRWRSDCTLYSTLYCTLWCRASASTVDDDSIVAVKRHTVQYRSFGDSLLAHDYEYRRGKQIIYQAV